MSVIILDHSPKSSCALHLLNRDIQKKVLSFCDPVDPFLYARVNRAAAAFSEQNAVRSLYLSLKSTKHLDWQKIEKNTAILAHITDPQIQNLNEKEAQNFTEFMHQFREIEVLDDAVIKNAKLFKLFLSFCTNVTKLDFTTRKLGERLGNMRKHLGFYVLFSILNAPDIQSQIKELSLNEYAKNWALIPVFSSRIIHFDSLKSLACYLSTEELDILTSTPSFQSHLKSLSIERAYLPSLAPLQKLSNLQSLDLSDCIITDFYHPNLPLMPQLKTLEIGPANDINDFTVQAICQAFHCLERLKIHAKRITDLSVHSISQLQFLKELYLSPCSELTDKAFEYLAASPYLRENLQSLSIHSCSVAANNGLKHIANFTNLIELDLTASEFTEDAFEFLVALQKLQKINCFRMQSTDRMLVSIGEIRSLQHVEFYNGPSGKTVTDLGIKALRNLKNLRSFTLYNSDQITDEGYRHLGSLTCLEHVQMTSTRPISTATLQNLGKLRRLQKLYLYGKTLDAPKEEVMAFLASCPELDYTCVVLGDKNSKAIQQFVD